MRFSASRIKTWMDCPLRAHYHYDRHLPRRQTGAARFGQVVHEAVAVYYETRGDIQLALDTFKQRWAMVSKEDLVWHAGTSFGGYMDRGKEMLDRLHSKHRWQRYTHLGSEIGFVVPFGRHELHGYIDALGIEKSGTGKELLKITDFKTSTKAPTLTELALDPQFSVYLYAVNQEQFWVGDGGEFKGIDNGAWLWATVGRDIPKRAIWRSLHTGRQIDAGPRTPTDYRRLLRVCEEIDKAIKADIHVPKIGPACGRCDFQDPCELEIPVAINALNDSGDPNRWI